MPKVTLRDNESIERALRFLKKKVEREGLLKQVRKHEYYEKPSERRRRRVLRQKLYKGKTKQGQT